MELPIEIVGIISELSKPLMKYSGEYKSAIQALDVRNIDPEARLEDSDKNAIKTLLCSDKAQVVIKALLDFADAVVGVDTAVKAADHYLDTVFPYDGDDANVLYFEADRRYLLQVDARTKLFEVLRG